MSLFTTATLGSFTFQDADAVVPGSDTGWILEPTIQQTRNLGASRDNIIEMSRGSHTRSFSARMAPDRYTALKALLRSVQSFTDWSDDTRPAYVKTVKREQGSRPFLFIVTVELVEQ